jgi:hypothetical protein
VAFEPCRNLKLDVFHNMYCNTWCVRNGSKSQIFRNSEWDLRIWEVGGCTRTKYNVRSTWVISMYTNARESLYSGGKLNLQIGQANLIFIHCNRQFPIPQTDCTSSRQVVWKTCPHGVRATFRPSTLAERATVSLPPPVDGNVGSSIGCIHIAQSCLFPSNGSASSSSTCGAK